MNDFNEKIDAMRLTDDELENVSGGGITDRQTVTCPICKSKAKYNNFAAFTNHMMGHRNVLSQQGIDGHELVQYADKLWHDAAPRDKRRIYSDTL